MSAVERGAPPETRRGGNGNLSPEMVNLAKACEREPGEWFSIDRSHVALTTAYHQANDIRKGLHEPFKGPGWDATGRKLSDTEWRLYVRRIAAPVEVPA